MSALPHREKAEQALGRPLPSKHPVHHVDEDPSNNANGNLVICESNAYHKLLHKRANRIRRGLDLEEPFLHPLIRFRCTSAFKEALRRVARRNKRSMSDQARLILLDYADQEELRLGITKAKPKAA